jgi:hypothetical protein
MTYLFCPDDDVPRGQTAELFHRASTLLVVMPRVAQELR